jgi:hypothetical protein
LDLKIRKDFNNYIVICLENIIEEQKGELFKNEWDIESKLSIKLKDKLKIIFPKETIHVIVEFPDVNFYLSNNYELNKTDKKNHSIDFVIIINDNYYLFELKYSYYCNIINRIVYSKGTRIEDTLKNYINDIVIIQELVNNNKDIECGYCILILSRNLKDICLENFNLMNVEVICSDLKEYSCVMVNIEH